MARELDPTRPFGRQIRRLVRRRLRESVELLDAARALDEGSELDAAVHRVRRNVKEVRALLRLMGDRRSGAAHELDQLVHQAARCLGPVRDASVRAQLIARLVDDPAAHDLTAETGPEDDSVDRGAEVLERALRVADRLPATAGVAELRTGLRRSYRACRRAHRRARREPSPMNVHRWRIRNKRLWYQVRVVAVAAPSVLDPMSELLDEVGELLGEIHDIDVLLASGDDRLTDDRRLALVSERDRRLALAVRLGSTIHLESDDAFVERLVAAWRVAARQGPEPVR